MRLQKTYTVEEAKRRLERYCVYQERCHKEVQQKLRDMRMIPEAQDLIIVHLLEHNFLNEERFAKSFVRGKFTMKQWGKVRLRLELKQRAIHKTLIDAAINDIKDEDYDSVFDTLAKKKVAQLQEQNLQKKRKKLADYLLYRGWESHRVYDKIRELIP